MIENLDRLDYYKNDIPSCRMLFLIGKNKKKNVSKLNNIFF